MKSLLSILAFCLAVQSQAQYVYGEETLDTVMTHMYSPPDWCQPPEFDIEFTATPNVFSTIPDGMELYFQLDNFEPSDGALGINGEVVVEGQVIQLHPDSTLRANFFTVSTLTFSYLLAGIPSTIGEPYYCDYDSTFTLAICNNWYSLIADPDTYTCEIVDPNIIEEEGFDPLQWSLFPNPTNDDLTVKIDPSLVGSQLRITDSVGRVHDHRTLTDFTNKFSVSGLSRGLYLISIRTDGGLRSTRLLVK